MIQKKPFVDIYYWFRVIMLTRVGSPKKSYLTNFEAYYFKLFYCKYAIFFFNFSLAKKPLFENDYNKSKAHQYFLVLLKKCLKYKYILSRKNKNKIIFTLENISGMTCLASTAWISSLEGQISAKNISFPSWSWASGSFSKSISTRPARA